MVHSSLALTFHHIVSRNSTRFRSAGKWLAEKATELVSFQTCGQRCHKRDANDDVTTTPMMLMMMLIAVMIGSRCQARGGLWSTSSRWNRESGTTCDRIVVIIVNHHLRRRFCSGQLQQPPLQGDADAPLLLGINSILWSALHSSTGGGSAMRASSAICQPRRHRSFNLRRRNPTWRYKGVRLTWGWIRSFETRLG